MKRRQKKMQGKQTTQEKNTDKMEDEQGRKDGTLTLTEGQVSFAFPKVDTVVMVPISIGQIYLEERPLTRIMCEDLHMDYCFRLSPYTSSNYTVVVLTSQNL